MGNASADNLIERILSEARQGAEKIGADASATCDEIKKERDERIAQISSAAQKARDVQVKEILGGAKTRAELDGRKELLAQKRAVLDHAFAAAYDALCKKNADELERLYASVLRAEAEPGNVIVAASADRETLSRAAKSAGLTLSDADAAIERGFILKGGSYEKNCSLKAILTELRDREETAVADILFSEQ